MIASPCESCEFMAYCALKSDRTATCSLAVAKRKERAVLMTLATIMAILLVAAIGIYSV